MLTRLRKMGPAGYMAAGFVGAAMLLGGTGAAYAANGGSFILGANNAETKGAGLANSNGTPLYLASKAGTPPLVVYSSTTVPRLSADALDGMDHTGFAYASGKTGVIEGNSAGDASNDGLASTAWCPAGTTGVGGGGFAPSLSDYLWYSGPDWNPNTNQIVPNSWYAADDNSDATAYVVCYNPHGAVPGAMTAMQLQAMTAATHHKLAHK